MAQVLCCLECGRRGKEGPFPEGSPTSLPSHLPVLTDEQKSRIQAMKPMTKEEWDARQSVIRKVVDPETGRTRWEAWPHSCDWALAPDQHSQEGGGSCCCSKKAKDEREKTITWWKFLRPFLPIAQSK